MRTLSVFPAVLLLASQAMAQSPMPNPKPEINPSLEINAYYYPTEHKIVITQGMIEFSTEEQLRFVIGHEMGHAAIRHFRLCEPAPDRWKFLPCTGDEEETLADLWGVYVLIEATGRPYAAAEFVGKMFTYEALRGRAQSEIWHWFTSFDEHSLWTTRLKRMNSWVRENCSTEDGYKWKCSNPPSR